ncbi:MAG TPA: peptidyl-alpha-hydroxyglycine alpha-amidating lyase family protein [Vicinamibacterales bacterium]
MKRLFVAAAVAALTASAGVGVTAQSKPAAPQIPFTFSNPLKLPPRTYLGEAAGVALNSKGDIYVYSRTSDGPRLWEFDPTGNLLHEIGQGIYGFYQAHAVRVDTHDNIWVVDEGTNTVMEFDPQFRVKMVIGRRWERVDGPPKQPSEDAPPPRAQKGLFNRETDITWDHDGNMYIADGYNNSRVTKFDKDGNWIKAWGQRGTGPGEFHTVHTIAIDNQDHIYVGDRENRRIQVFDTDGTFLRQITGIGAPWAICITPGPHQVLYSSDSVPGQIYKLDLDGKILGVFGKAGKQPGEFGWVHEIACPSENTLYVAELLNWRVQKVELHPTK